MEILTVATTNSALFQKKVNMPKTVQTLTIEQSLFAVHKSPNFTSYVCVSYIRATFSVMNIRPNNILYHSDELLSVVNSATNCIFTINLALAFTRAFRLLFREIFNGLVTHPVYFYADHLLV